MKTELYYVVFDGTSAFVVPFEDIDDNEILFKHSNIDIAQNYCDKENELIKLD